MTTSTPTESLRARLDHQPIELKFGTSGRRGKVVDLTQLEIYLDASAELEFLQSLPVAAGGVRRGDDFYFAYDLRPSSTRLVAEESGRGEIAQAIVAAIRDAGLQPVNLGPIPSPALMLHATARAAGSIMVTGSHIPFDRNGYKLNTSCGELRKEHEAPIGEVVRRVRDRLYAQAAADSPFDDRGMFKCGSIALPPESAAGRSGYLDRYLEFFSGDSLQGWRLAVYQHSAVGRDLLVELLTQLGAEVVPCGRSETFVPIDTENIDAAQLASIQALVDEAAAQHGPLDAVLSLDGDSDRPLVLGVDGATQRVRFFGGDLLGMVVAEFLGADAVVVPISCNDAIDRGALASVLQPKTRIGSPYVIAAMETARAKGSRRVCGWEANGGFLTGSDIERNGRRLSALATRDALLPIVSALLAARAAGTTLIERFERLPRRFSKAALLREFPRATALQMLAQFTPATARSMEQVVEKLSAFFPAQLGFSAIERVDYTDGVRVLFTNGDVAHLRPSGNADELRIYAVADSRERCEEIARLGVAEPDGILRRMERAAVLP